MPRSIWHRPQVIARHVLAGAVCEKQNRAANVIRRSGAVHRLNFLSFDDAVKHFLAQRIAEPVRADKARAYRIDANIVLTQCAGKRQR